MATHNTEKTIIVDGEVHMEKTITKRYGDNFVKLTAGATLPIELASTSDKELRDAVHKSLRKAYIRISNIIDDELETQFDTIDEENSK